MRKEILVLGAIVLVVIVAAVVGSNYYTSSTQSVRRGTDTTAPAAPGSNSATPTAPAALLVRPDSASIGPADAKVTLVEFYDPECGTCATFNPIVKKILELHEGRIRYVVRYVPQHTNSMFAV